MRRIGFIGLGVMGKPMAKNLISAGYPLVAYDIRPEPLAEVVKAGAKEGKSSADVAAQNEVVITMLPNSPHVKEAVLGEAGVLEGANQGLILVDMSSIAPLVSVEVSKKAAEKGVKMLDAPVSGGEPKAMDGTLAIMAGGPEDVFNEVKEILEVMGASVTLVGDVGSGNTTRARAPGASSVVTGAAPSQSSTSCQRVLVPGFSRAKRNSRKSPANTGVAPSA